MLGDQMEQDLQEAPLISPDPRQKKFQCTYEGCGKRFNRRTDVTRHMRVHSNERPFKCTWEGCEKAFMQRSALKIHYRTHTGEKPNKCPFEGCNKAFNDTSSLARHRRTHQFEKPFPCQVKGCGEQFASRKELLQHESNHRDGEPKKLHRSASMINIKPPVYGDLVSPFSPLEPIAFSDSNFMSKQLDSQLLSPCDTPEISPVLKIDSFHHLSPPTTQGQLFTTQPLPRLNTSFGHIVDNLSMYQGPYSAPVQIQTAFSENMGLSFDEMYYDRRASLVRDKPDDWPMMLRPFQRPFDFESHHP
ncbi:hypothetical protein EDD86DRAFT_210923 [Gorgonomyces haynaldii]|nr:hypothetical protein EDD86DRAFT_210923 [Gorgonomyces haynaldii]